MNTQNTNEKALKKLPVGIQDFEKLRREGCLYVDKTEYLVRLIDSGSVYFLSRPRRFGKSLTVSTFEALFSGKRELFKGLYAEAFFERPDYHSSPVIHLDMSTPATNLGLDCFCDSVLKHIQKNAEQHAVQVADGNMGDTFNELIWRVAEKHGPAVILVDEYDKPILDTLTEPQKAQAFRTVLRNLYTQIKASDAYIRFVFMTGITKFTKTGIFSAMNNLYDLSSDSDYAQMIGYTESELRSHFKEYIATVARSFDVSEEVLSDQLRSYYDGFSFDGKNHVYNPFSTLNFFRMKQFKNYWFESGQSSFIANYIQTHALNVESFRGLEVPEDFTAAHEIENAEPESFLFQSGYLTLREQRLEQDTFCLTYVLDYPNTEVLSSVMRLFVRDVSGLGNDFLKINRELVTAFDADDLETVVAVFNRVFASIPYNLFDDKEKYYHSLLYAIMVSAGIDARAEDRSKAGSADIVVHRKGHFYVIEVKTATTATGCESAAKRAIEQIHAHGYHVRFPQMSTILLGLAVDIDKKCIGHVIIERPVE